MNEYIIIQNNGNWLITSILYASYNSVLLIPILISIKGLLKNSKDVRHVAIIVSLILITLLTIVYLFLINIDVDIKKLQMPAVYAINNIWPEIKKFYGIIILISIFTTAISLGIGFLKNVTVNKKGYNSIAFLMCASAVIFSGIGFSNLVNILYPILGIFGFIQIVQIILQKKEKTDIT